MGLLTACWGLGCGSRGEKGQSDDRTGRLEGSLPSTAKVARWDGDLERLDGTLDGILLSRRNPNPIPSFNRLSPASLPHPRTQFLTPPHQDGDLEGLDGALEDTLLSPARTQSPSLAITTFLAITATPNPVSDPSSPGRRP